MSTKNCSTFTSSCQLVVDNSDNDLIDKLNIDYINNRESIRRKLCKIIPQVHSPMSTRQQLTKQQRYQLDELSDTITTNFNTMPSTNSRLFKKQQQQSSSNNFKMGKHVPSPEVPAALMSPEVDISLNLRDSRNRLEKYPGITSGQQSIINQPAPTSDGATVAPALVIGNNTNRGLMGDKKQQQQQQPADDESVNERLARMCPFIGIFLTLVASLASVLGSTTIKLQDSLTGLEFTFYRCQLMFLYIFLYIVISGELYKRENLNFTSIVNRFAPNNGERKLYFLRTLAYALMVGCYYHAVVIVPLPDYTTLRFTQSMWALIIARFYLNELCSGKKITALIVSMLGVIFITRPDDIEDLIKCFLSDNADAIYTITTTTTAGNLSDLAESLVVVGEGETLFDTTSDSLLSTTVHNVATPPGDTIAQIMHSRSFGIISVLAGAFFGALSLVLTKSCKSTPTTVLMFWFSVFLGALSLLTASSTSSLRLPNNFWVLFMILLNFCCTMITQPLIILALKFEDSGIVTLLRTFDIVLAFFIDIVILQEDITTYSIVGSLLIGGSVILLVLEKMMLNKRKTKEAYNKKVDDSNSCFVNSLCCCCCRQSRPH